MTSPDPMSAAVRHRRDDEAACMRLCVDFAHHLDARRYGPVLDLFTDDGVLDRMGTVFAGRAELDRFLEARSSAVTTRHLCTNIRVDFDGEDDATGSCYVLFFQGSNEGSTVAKAQSAASVVEYHDSFVRTPAGWRIRERRIRMAIQA